MTLAVTPRAAQTQNIRAFQNATRNVHLVIESTKTGIRAGLTSFGVQVVSELRREVSRPGSGAVYRRRSVVHRASAPGEPPAVDTGQLRASFSFAVGDRYVDVGTNQEKAPHLEFGTVNMAPRPYFRPVILRSQPGPKVAAAVTAAEAKAIKAAGGQVRGALGQVRSSGVF